MTTRVEQIAEQVKSLPLSEREELLAWLGDFELGQVDAWVNRSPEIPRRVAGCSVFSIAFAAMSLREGQSRLAKSSTTSDFWAAYRGLPPDIRRRARAAYRRCTCSRTEGSSRHDRDRSEAFEEWIQKTIDRPVEVKGRCHVQKTTKIPAPTLLLSTLLPYFLRILSVVPRFREGGPQLPRGQAAIVP